MASPSSSRDAIEPYSGRSADYTIICKSNRFTYAAKLLEREPMSRRAPDTTLEKSESPAARRATSARKATKKSPSASPPVKRDDAASTRSLDRAKAEAEEKAASKAKAAVEKAAREKAAKEKAAVEMADLEAKAKAAARAKADAASKSKADAMAKAEAAAKAKAEAAKAKSEAAKAKATQAKLKSKPKPKAAPPAPVSSPSAAIETAPEALAERDELDVELSNIYLSVPPQPEGPSMDSLRGALIAGRSRPEVTPRQPRSPSRLVVPEYLEAYGGTSRASSPVKR